MYDEELISVIIPIYNAQRFIRETVDSVLAQTYQNFELLLIDDCSTDNSLEIAREYAAADSRVKVISMGKNSGVSCARNRGIDMARGTYIALLDSDDVWDKSKLEMQLFLLKKTNAQIAYCSYDFMDEESNPVNKPFLVPEQTDYNGMLVKSVIGCSTSMVWADLLKTHHLDSTFWHEDYVLWMELLSLPGVRAVGVKNVLMHYRIVKGSRSHNKIKCAVGRWKIYRNALNMNLFQSAYAFFRYSLNGIIKYYI